MKMIDAHIHLDRYSDEKIALIMNHTAQIEAFISVSYDLESCKKNFRLSEMFSKVKPAFGHHPEQPLPIEAERAALFSWIEEHQHEMAAIGEVGLPYYLRQNNKITPVQHGQYIEFLEAFIKMAKRLDKPVALHAVYDDAPIVCDLLEKFSHKKAHFHWFKGDPNTTTRMIENGYFISVTPEVVYKPKIQQLTASYPLEQMMIETDGPWPFEGPFRGQMTHPNMMEKSIKMIANIKKVSEDHAARTLLENTLNFYQISL